MSNYTDFKNDFERGNKANQIVAHYIRTFLNVDLRITENIISDPETATALDKWYAEQDIKYGCDAFTFDNDKPVHGVAMRSQLDNYNSFTIRLTRKTGTLTEFKKRIADIEDEGNYPKYTIHSYYTRLPMQFNKCLYVNEEQTHGIYRIGIVHTKELYAEILRRYEHYYANCNYTNPADENTFLAVNFEDLPTAKIYSLKSNFS